MSKENRDLARVAQKHLKEAKENSKEAQKIFKIINDPDGEKIAGDVVKKAEDAEGYVSKRLNGN